MGEMRFEEAFKKLEEIVRELEKSDIALDDALKMYEEGKRHAEVCRRKLEKAEEKIKKLVKKDDQYELEDFEESGGTG
jgi:exodeoxyribonuclease VII small subunit